MSPTATLWQELTVQALLGTLRQPFTPPQAGEALASAVHAASSPAAAAGDGEHALLRAAAIAALHHRAGQLPDRLRAPLPTPCPAEKWPRCSPQAAACLQAILSGDFIALLPEWIELAAAHQVRVCEELLPDLLQQRKTLQELRPDLLAVLGERGRWLARHNPDWREFEPFDDDTVWQEGRRQQRLTFLKSLRRQDPARARDLLMTTWGQESFADKVAFLKLLAEGLSMADEPFLEGVLDDRHKDVRQTAARLLARLPDSRLAQRRAAHARRLLTWKSGLLRSGLEVKLPEACDPDMERDGMDPSPPPGFPLGEKAWWLAQALALTPPAVWCSLTNRRPHQLFDLLRKHEWEEAIYLGWRQAAILSQNTEWLEALLQYEIRWKEKNIPSDTFTHLAPAAQEAFFIRLAAESPSLAYDEPASAYLSACRHPWSQELTQAVTLLICDHIHKSALQPWRWDRLLANIAPRFHPHSIPAVVQQIAAELSHQREPDSAVEKMLAILQFRHDMIQSFDRVSMVP